MRGVSGKRIARRVNRINRLAMMKKNSATGNDQAIQPPGISEAVQSRHKLRLRYRDVDDSLSERVVRPLGCFYWGKVWTLSAWCELRQDFRGFRVDRIESVQTLETQFRDEPGKTLAELLRKVGSGVM